MTTYTVLISACVKGHEVEEILGQLAELHLQPNAGVPNPDLIEALAVRAQKGQKIELAIRLFVEMQKHQFKMELLMRGKEA